MKPSAIITAAAAAIVMSAGAIAGNSWTYDYERIFGDRGHQGGYYIRAFDSCNASLTSVSGYTQIYGYIAGVYVSEYKTYTDSCPQIHNNRNNKNPSNVISLNGVVVTSDCTDQVTQHGSGSGQYKGLDQKPQNTSDQYAQHWTSGDNRFNGSCVITATNAFGGTETYGWFAYTNGYHSRSHANN